MKRVLPMVIVTLLPSIARADLEDVRRNAQDVVDYVEKDKYRQESKRLDESGWLVGQVGYCLSDVKEALASNPATAKVQLKHATGERSYTLAEVRDQVCGPVEAELMQRKLLGPLWRAASHVGNQLENLGTDPKHTTTTVGLLTDFAAECVLKADEATAAGVPGSRVVEFQGNDVTVAQLRQLCEAGGKQAAEVAARIKAEEEAKFAPYWKVLTADKRKVFDSTYKLGMNVYGPRGKLLTTPAQFKAAAVWFTYGVNRDGIQPRWETDRYKFKGMKQVGAVGGTSGVGDEPPTSAFK